MYSVMWSEHCSYKSSRVHLRRLPSEGDAVLVGPGENAGVVDVGETELAQQIADNADHGAVVVDYEHGHFRIERHRSAP